jgi:transcriptional regulator with XRE-family HTH domain
MSFVVQLADLRKKRGIKMADLGVLVGMKRSNLSATLAGRHDTRGSTLEGLAAGLDAQWVLVPKEKIVEVQRVLARGDAEPGDDYLSSDYAAPSAAKLLLSSR